MDKHVAKMRDVQARVNNQEMIIAVINSI